MQMNPSHKFQGKSKKFFQKKVDDPVDERDVEATDREQWANPVCWKSLAEVEKDLRLAKVKGR